jgi:hypothetical protein
MGGLTVQAPAVDGEVRAVEAAEVATATFFKLYQMRRMISLGVKCGRHGKGMGGTKLDADGATLATLDQDMDTPLWHGEPPGCLGSNWDAK